MLPASLSSLPRRIAKLPPQSFVTSSLKDNNRGNWNFPPHLPGFLMNLSAVCEICVTVCVADRLGPRFIPPSPRPPPPASWTRCQTTILEHPIGNFIQTEMPSGMITACRAGSTLPLPPLLLFIIPLGLMSLIRKRLHTGENTHAHT